MSDYGVISVTLSRGTFESLSIARGCDVLSYFDLQLTVVLVHKQVRLFCECKV